LWQRIIPSIRVVGSEPASFINMNKHVNIQSPVGNAFASFIVFELIQGSLKLHPGKLAKDIKAYATDCGKDIEKTVRDMKYDFAIVLGAFFEEVMLELRGRGIRQVDTFTMTQLCIKKRLELDAVKVAEYIKDKAKGAEVSPIELCTYFRRETINMADPECILEKVFAKIEKILQAGS